MSVRVLLADDHPVVRDGLRSVLGRESDITVVGKTADGNAAVEAVREHLPDVVVMDVSMPGLNGVEATRRIVGEFPRVLVLGLSLSADRHLVSEMLQANASGYVLKDAASEELVTAVRTVAANRTYLGPTVVGGVVRDYVANLDESRSRDGPQLTSRELEVLQLIAEGQDTAAIAARLRISTKTVGSHRGHIMKKLDLHSVAALTKYAIREGISTAEADRK